MAQVQSAQEKHADDLYEMSKPLARYRDDEDLERLLKEREREGDPMLKFMKKKNKGNKDTKNKKKQKKGKDNRQLITTTINNYNMYIVSATRLLQCVLYG